MNTVRIRKNDDCPHYSRLRLQEFLVLLVLYFSNKCLKEPQRWAAYLGTVLDEVDEAGHQELQQPVNLQIIGEIG